MDTERRFNDYHAGVMHKVLLLEAVTRPPGPDKARSNLELLVGRKRTTECYDPGITIGKITSVHAS